MQFLENKTTFAMGVLLYFGSSLMYVPPDLSAAGVAAENGSF